MSHPWKDPDLAPVMHEISHMVRENGDDKILINNIIVELARKLEPQDLDELLTIIHRLSISDPKFHV